MYVSIISHSCQPNSIDMFRKAVGDAGSKQRRNKLRVESEHHQQHRAGSMGADSQERAESPERSRRGRGMEAVDTVQELSHAWWE